MVCPASAAANTVCACAPICRPSSRKTSPIVSVAYSLAREALLIIRKLLFEMAGLVAAQVLKLCRKQEIALFFGKALRVLRALAQQVNQVGHFAQKLVWQTLDAFRNHFLISLTIHIPISLPSTEITNRLRLA